MAEFLSSEDHDLQAQVAQRMHVVVQAQERQIQEWRDRIDHSFQLAKSDFYGLEGARDDLSQYQASFADALTMMAVRTNWLANNPGEEVHARLEASAEAARITLEHSRTAFPEYPQEEGYEEGYEDEEESPWEPTIAPHGSGEYDLQGYLEMDEGQDVLVIDTQDSDVGASWQDQLAELETRLEALTHGEDDAYQQHVDHTEGMSY